MSRIAIISDVHGNSPALEAVLDDIKTKDVVQIISLGDVAGYGPFINECCDTLRKNNVINLMGNHDQYLTSDALCERSHTVNVAIAYQKDIISDENMQWLSASPLHYTLPNISMVHAGWKHPTEEYMVRLSADYFEEYEESLFISGHTHVQGVWKLGDKTYANPGSVGQPRDGEHRAAYAVLDTQTLTLEVYRIAYDVPRFQSACVVAGLPEGIGQCVAHGTRVDGKTTSVTVL